MGKSRSVVAAWVMIVGACSAGSEFEAALPPPSGAICNPGSESACTCPSGATGTQACSNNGQAFADCVCNEQDAGLVPIAAGRGGAADASPLAPPNCQLTTIPRQVTQPCPISGPPLMFHCPTGAPPGSGCVQPDPAQPLWCCP